MFPDPVREADEVLVSGPLLSGKRTVFHRLLREWGDEPVVTSTRRGAERVRRDHERATGCDGDDLVVVDCVTATHEDDPSDTPRTKYAAGPGNLTDVGTTYTEVLAERDDATAVGITSISPLLMYAPLDAVYRFTRLVAQQAVGEGYPIAAVVESQTHDDQELHTISEPFDAIIETRVAGDDAEFRARSRAGTTEWRPIPDEWSPADGT